MAVPLIVFLMKSPTSESLNKIHGIEWCETHDRHYDPKNGCSGCPSNKDKEIIYLKNEILKWKETWFLQREATGKLGWEIPNPNYLSEEKQNEFIQFSNKLKEKQNGST